LARSLDRSIGLIGLIGRRHAQLACAGHDGAMTVGTLRAMVAVVWVGGIAGMVAGTVADNNMGVVVTAGMATAVASLVLMGACSIALPPAAVDLVLAERIEGRIGRLVDTGSADEEALRELVRDSVRLGRAGA
jgi:hypothetical protein